MIFSRIPYFQNGDRRFYPNLNLSLIMIEYLPLVLTGLGITASITYYTITIRNQYKARQKELLYQRITMNNYDFYLNWRKLRAGFANITSYKEWAEYLSENPEHYAIFASMTWTFHNVGLLLKNKMIDSETVFGAYSPNLVIWLWEEGEKIIDVWRKAINFPQHYEGFEYLYNEAKRLFPDIHSSDEFRRTVTELTGYHR